MDLMKMRALAGIPVDLSKPANAKATIRTPARLIAEASKVPQHRGELAPKTKDNMRARVNHAKKALEALELARDELMDLPAIDYMTDVPDIIKQLHNMLHGEDGTGGVHHLHRHYKHEFDNTVFPEDVEEEKRKTEADAQGQEAGVTGDEKDTSKKPVKEGANDTGLIKQKVDPAKENKKPFKLAPDSLPLDKTMVVDPKQAKTVGEDPADNSETDDKVVEDIHPDVVKAVDDEDHANIELSKNPFAKKKHDKTEEAEEEEATEDEDEIHPEARKAAKDSAELKDWNLKTPFEQEEKKVDEGQGPLFARDAQHPKHGSEEGYSSWTTATKPVNAVSSEDGPSLYYPEGSKRENANQLSTNPYNESQKANVPAKIKTQLKEEANKARKLAETFTMRKDWDSKNFHETLANAMDTLTLFLEKGTIYGIKEAQVFMTSLMSPFTNKIPADVIKFVASGGSLRSLKSYVNDVKAPHTGTVFQQDSDGTK